MLWQKPYKFIDNQYFEWFRYLFTFATKNWHEYSEIILYFFGLDACNELAGLGLTFHGNFHLFNVKAYQGWLSRLPDTIQLNGNVENASSVSDKSEDRSPRADIRQVKSFDLKVPMNPNAISVAGESVLRCAYLIMYSASEQFYWQHRNDGYNFPPKVPI